LADLDLSGDQSAQDHDENAGVTPAANQIADYSAQQPAGSPPEHFKVLDYTDQPPGPPPPSAGHIQTL